MTKNEIQEYRMMIKVCGYKGIYYEHRKGAKTVVWCYNGAVYNTKILLAGMQPWEPGRNAETDRAFDFQAKDDQFSSFVYSPKVFWDLEHTINFDPSPAPKPKKKKRKPSKAWNEIGGQENAKKALREAIEAPILNADLFKSYGMKGSRGILLYGPPGCGKTMLARAASKAVAEMCDTPNAFLSVKGPELMDPYLGNSEKKVRDLFAKAKEHKSRHGSPAILFIDEADSVLGHRGGGSFHESFLVPSFLTEMDGLEESSAIVILATNRPDSLDSAIVRDGRIDRKIEVVRPSRDDARAILGAYLKQRKVRDPRADVAETILHEIYRPARVLHEIAEHRFLFHHLISGALLHGVVERATGIALARDVVKKRKRASGILCDDAIEAVETVYKDNRTLRHPDAMIEWATREGIVEKIVQRAVAPRMTVGGPEPKFYGEA